MSDENRTENRTAARRSAIKSRWGKNRLMALVGVKMMFHDRAKLVGTLLGVIFATVLVNQQLGVLMGLLQKNIMFVENAGADIWVIPPGMETLTGGTRMSIYNLNQARVAEGVAWAEPLAFGTASMSLPSGGSEAVTLVGTRLTHYGGGPWNIVAGDAESLAMPDTVIFEDSRRDELGGINIGSVRELGGHRVVAGGFTWGLLPFGPSYAFTEFDTARSILNIPSDQTTFVLVGVQPGADPHAVRDELAFRMPDHQVILREDFMGATVRNLIRAQLGISFGTSTAFGVIVGFVIVALSMFSAVVDNIREFGTLKAMGASNFDLSKLLFVQSIAYAVVGSIIGLFLVTGMSEGIRSANLVLVLPWWMYAGTFAFMIVLCLVASGLALLRVRNVEPGMVFR
jgi:putative ABC transport system permease protein